MQTHPFIKANVLLWTQALLTCVYIGLVKSVQATFQNK